MTLRASIVTAILLAVLGVGPAGAASCRSDLLAAAKNPLSAPPVRLVYRIHAGPIRVGKPFAVEVIACLEPGNAAPVRLRVDARMPAHGHAMNYKPTMRTIGPGHARFEGLLFHMPGRWEITFDVTTKSGRKRLAVPIDVTR